MRLLVLTARISGGAVLLASALFAVACGGPTFASASGGASGSGGTGTGGTAGASGSGAAAGASGQAGATGGTGGGGGCTTIADCPAGNYCAGGTCLTCGNTTSFAFGTAEQVAKLAGATSGDQRFPRVSPNGLEMFFRVGADGQAQELWLTTDFNANAPTAMGSAVNVSGKAASGPLAVPASLAGIGAHDFLFDRTSGGPGTQRSIFAGLRTGKNLANVVALPPPLNTAASTTASDYSIAVSPQANRAWWMSNRSGGPELLTTATGSTDQPAPVQIVMSPSGCHRTGADATPWAAPDGSFLLFRGPETGANCSVANVNDLYVVPLDSDGQATIQAIQLSDVSQPGRDETDPSMSPNLCWLYFSVNSGNGYDVYRAPRK